MQEAVRNLSDLQFGYNRVRSTIGADQASMQPATAERPQHPAGGLQKNLATPLSRIVSSIILCVFPQSSGRAGSSEEERTVTEYG